MIGKIGLEPVPDDEEILEFIRKMIMRDLNSTKRHLQELSETIETTVEIGEPADFAYAKMLNFLSEQIDLRDLIHLAASAMWSILWIIKEAEAENNRGADLFVLRSEFKDDKDKS